MINNIIFITVLVYTDSMSRLVIRDDRAEMKQKVKDIRQCKSKMYCIDCIAEYHFKERLTKYYTIDEFLESVD